MLLGGSGTLGSQIDQNNATQIGIRTLYRTYDEDSIDFDESEVGDYQFLTSLYFIYKF